jgi:hypothetical protein
MDPDTWIRTLGSGPWIRTLGSVHLITGPSPSPVPLVSDFWRSKLKHSVFNFFLGLLLSVGTFTSVLKDDKSLWVTKQQKSRHFFIFCLLMEGFGSVQIIKDTIHEAQKHSDPTATDPDHGSGRLIIFAVFLFCNIFIIFILCCIWISSYLYLCR